MNKKSVMYQSLNYTLSNHNCNMWEYKQLTRIVEAMQRYIPKSIKLGKWVKPQRPDNLDIIIKRKQLSKGCGLDYRNSLRNIKHMAALKVETTTGLKIKPLLSVYLKHDGNTHMTINPAFFDLVFDFKSGVCYYDIETIFNFRNLYSIKLYQLLYSRERINLKIKDYRRFLNNINTNPINRVLVLRTLKEPQQHLLQQHLSGFNYTVNYSLRSWPKIINSVSLVSLDFIKPT